MSTKIVILSVLLISCNGLSIGSVNTSETSIGDVFPDWVPFKNKHGDELGEFVSVVTKNKVKKRLALPAHFVLRAAAESDSDHSDDYYGQEGTDSESNYEYKDWSDLQRPAIAVDHNKEVNHTDISDIDGIVNILTKKRVNSVADAINNARQLDTETSTEKSDEEHESEGGTTEILPKISKVIPKKQKVSYDDVDYDESNYEKEKRDPVEDVSQTEAAKKAKILDAVDELKERHTQESRALSEKVKEEEMYKEEFERNKVHIVEDKEEDKYERRKLKKKIVPDYDEYDYKSTPLLNQNKYYPIKIETTTSQPTRTTTQGHTNNINSIRKVSVFENPKLYLIDDGSHEETTIAQPKRGQHKFSARYISTPSTDNEDDERISLIAEDSKEGEPTLFFPKKSKRRKIKPTESYYTQTVNDNLKHTTKDTTAADTRTDTILHTAPSGTDDDVTASGSDVTDPDTETSAYTKGSDDIMTTETEGVTDTVPASTDHEKKEKDLNSFKEKGEGREHDSEHEEEHEEHGKKAYKGSHEDTKIAKGHHDKENHLGKYNDHGGVDKHHSEESGHFGDHNHEEHGKKHAKYEESGKHSKGHSTKGSHDVHKKDEYEKKVEFFEEEGDSAEDEKHGGYNHEREHSEGGKFKKSNLKAHHDQHSNGKSGNFEKGGNTHWLKGHKLAAGNDNHGKQKVQHFHKDGNQGGKKWVFHHGIPARTTNLAVIDRRGGQQLFHGPLYYG